MKKILPLSILTPLILTACVGDTTPNQSCYAPEFNGFTAQTLINNWAQGLQIYNESTYGPIGVESSAAYFTMLYYVTDAILQPTVSETQRYGTQEIYNYFTHFLAKNPIMTLPQDGDFAYQSLGCGYGASIGDYDFTLYPGTQQESVVHARFTFIYRYEPNSFTESAIIESGPMQDQTVSQTNNAGWYIDAQQSSILPPSP